MKNQNYTTLIDQNYIPRLQLLIKSLFRHTSDFTFYIIALDQRTIDTFKNSRNCIVIPISNIHDQYPILDELKLKRDNVSYIFTLSPFYPLYILEKYPEIDHICSLDADQYFFANPESIFNLLDKYSVLITPHRFSRRLKDTSTETFGLFNVSFQIFKRNLVGLECLKFWCSQCQEWCFDRIEPNLFADQKYLDSWQNKFGDEVHAINNKGVGLAPWNFEDVKIKKKNGKIFVDDDQLILFHYQGLKIFNYGLVYTYIDTYAKTNLDSILKYIYPPIIKRLLDITDKVDSFSRNFRTFEIDFFTDKKEFIFKRKYKIIFRYEKYLEIQNKLNAFINKLRNTYR